MEKGNDVCSVLFDLKILSSFLSAMNEFKLEDQLNTAEKDKVTKLLGELREIASKGVSDIRLVS